MLREDVRRENVIIAFKRQILLWKGRKEVVSLVVGLRGHKLPIDGCQYVDIGVGVHGFGWDFILVNWFPSNATSHM